MDDYSHLTLTANLQHFIYALTVHICTVLIFRVHIEIQYQKQEINIKQVLTPVRTEGVLHIGNDKQQLKPGVHTLATTIY